MFNTCLIYNIFIWIDSNAHRKITLNDLVYQSGYSKGYFIKIFKENSGVSPGEYIRARRLFQAADELRLTKKTIRSIAIRYDFRSQQAFSRSFKSFFGITPGSYRNDSV
ncbi:AraC family transcriptional regulator [Gibbsiella quercinecans]|uniref:AraC family transcriptional regulator n=1 Tax=Gibbsiella quercinecans TaxID=929813 RepID=UPI000EF1A74C